MDDLQLTYTKNADGTRTLTLPDDRRAAAIAFAHENATRPAAEIAAIVQQGHDALHAALAGISEAQAAWKPSPDDWSVLELLDHVVSAKRVVGILCANLAAGALPPGFGPQFEEQQAQDGVTIARFDTLAAARAAADDAHAALLAFIAGLDGDGVNSELTFRHFVFGAFNCRQWAVFQRVHDENHTPQVAAIKAAAGFPAA